MSLDKKQPINKLKLSCLLFLLLFSLFFTTGCWNRVEVNNSVEATGMVFDMENGQPSFSVQLAKPSGADQSGSSKGTLPTNISQTGDTFTEAARRTMLSLPRLPVWAHSSVLIIGKDLANQGMSRAADFLARNRNVRKTSQVFVSKVPGKECLEAELPMESYSLPGLKKLMRIQEQQLGIYMPVTLDQFLYALATPGIEPAVPYVTIHEIEGKKILRLEDTAVFKDKKVVGSLGETASKGYRFLSPKMITGGLIIIQSPLSVQRESDKLISVELTRSQASVKPQIEDNQLKKMIIHIEAEGNFYEQTFEGQVFKLEQMDKINTLVNEEIEDNINTCIKKAQSLDSDIFGWGQSIYRSNPALWSQLEQDWPTIFPGIQADISVNFKLRRSYLLDKSFEFKE